MVEFCFLQSLRLATQATSLYTREAHHHPTVHLKGVTHYTLRGRSVKRSTNKIARTPFDFSVGKPALWKVPIVGAFCFGYTLSLRIGYSCDRKNTGSHTPLVDRQTRLSGAECNRIITKSKLRRIYAYFLLQYNAKCDIIQS